jgi:hypothetical protein
MASEISFKIPQPVLVSVQDQHHGLVEDAVGEHDARHE